MGILKLSWLQGHKSTSDAIHRTALVLDVETTGLSPYRDEVVELAIVLFRFDSSGGIFRRSIEEYVGLREPSIPIPPAATRVHGLTNDHVAGHRLDEQRIRSLVSQAEFCIAHNASFDRPFVERLFPKLFRQRPWLCTMRDIDWQARGLTSRSLEAIARHHHIRHDQAHRALGDARTTFALLCLAGTNGEPLLVHLMEQHRRRTERRASAR